MPSPRTELIIVGGGLAGGLCALALKAGRSEVRVRIVEPAATIGGNHLWSYFDSDVDAAGRALLDPLVAHRWSGYSIRFPEHSRHLSQTYSTIESERLDAAVRAAGIEIVRAAAIAVTPTSATLDGGETITADAVLDARGLTEAPPGLTGGWQKFVGRLLTIPAGHGVSEPMVMDAAVDQSNGYRFVYLLPFSPTRLFVEDTYYNDDPDMDVAALDRLVEAYADDKGWAISARDRAEQGVLPVLSGGDFDAFWPATDTVARAGVRGGFFHPLTSYSLPEAVRFATWLAGDVALDQSFGPVTRERARRHWRNGRFERTLTRMLLKAAKPDQRYRILQRFYRLPEPLIERFYAGRPTFADKARVLIGKPPTSIPRAVKAILSK